MKQITLFVFCSVKKAIYSGPQFPIGSITKATTETHKLSNT